MAEDKNAGQGEFPDPKGMQNWLEHEITTIQKAAELRIREATRFVNEYARGDISKDEAERRCTEYADRWGDALPGVMGTKGLSDEEILRRLNEARVDEGLLGKHVLSRRKGVPETSR